MNMALETRKSSFTSERNFGLLVGGVFAALGVWWLHRGRSSAIAPAFLMIGCVLVILGVRFPRALVLVNRAWMALAEILGFVTTPVILAIVFYLVLTPIGCIKRLLGWDPLRLRATSSESYWTPYTTRQRDRRHYERMY
jgi:O-antigen ligase